MHEDFQSIKQTVNGRRRPIQEVATELRTLQLRLPQLTDMQLYRQLKSAMDPTLKSAVTPHINPDMNWNDMITLIVKYDDSQNKNKNLGHRFNNTYRKPIFQRSNFNQRQNNFGKSNNNQPWKNNNSNRPWNQSNNNNNNRWKGR